MPMDESKYVLDLNKLTLNFTNKKLEVEFRQSYFTKSLQVIRIAVTTTIFLYAGFGLLDKMVAPTYANEFIFIRFIIVIPLLFVFIGFTFIKSFRNYWQPLMSFFLVVAGSGIIYMLHRYPENLYYYGGLFLIFMGGYFFLKIRFVSASLSGLLLVLIYNVSYFIIPQTEGSSIDNIIVANAFFISSNIICMIGLYSIERLERIDFFQQKLLSGKQVEIESINADLEAKVKERTKDLMLSKEKAEESERLKSAFLANMSHEIRTPMNGILGFSELLKNPRLSGEEQQRFISIIKKSGDRMLNTVNDIIEISKIEAGQMEVILTTIDVVEEIKSIFEFFKPDAESKGIELTLQLKKLGHIYPFVTDHSKLSSILTNLIKNAIKYTEKGKIELVCKLQENELFFSVNDTGIGIPADRISAVFNRFEQADIIDKEARQGSGLGLAITKSYVEMLGGCIWVESRVDSDDAKSGSTFYLTLPLVRNEKIENVQKRTTVTTFTPAKLNILVVEDDEVSIQYINVLLKDFAKELLFAKSGTEALRKVHQNREIDLVLMDIRMPEMNGYEATKLIKEYKPHLPVIATTANAYPDDERRAQEAGCDGFIAKPINRKDLFSLIKEVVTGIK